MNNSTISEPLISIIVPVYNVELYLSRCIDSIINQSYKNLEIILVDDGSADNCGTICDDYAKKDGRIKVIHKKNGGQAEARNKGIKLANGEYISFVDSDDYIPPDAYKDLINYCIDSDMAQGTFSSVSPIRTKHWDRIKECICLTTANAMFNKYYKDKLITPMVWGKIYKRYLFDDILFPEDMLCEDAAIMFKILEKCKRVTLIPDNVYSWRVNSLSTTRMKKDRYYLGYIKYHSEQTHYLSDKYPYLSDMLYGNLCSSYADIYVELAARRNNSTKEQIAEMLKNDYNEQVIEQLECGDILKAIYNETANDALYKCIKKYKINLLKKDVKNKLKNLLGLFIKNDEFYMGL